MVIDSNKRIFGFFLSESNYFCSMALLFTLGVEAIKPTQLFNNLRSVSFTLFKICSDCLKINYHALQQVRIITYVKIIKRIPKN